MDQRPVGGGGGGGGRERGIKYYQNLQVESVLVEERLFVCHLK